MRKEKAARNTWNRDKTTARETGAEAEFKQCGQSVKSSAQKKWKTAVGREYFWRLLCSPVCIPVYFVSWRCLYFLCMYGGIRRNVPVLGLCFLFWLGWMILFFVRLHQSCKNSTPLIYEAIRMQGEELIFCIADYETRVPLKEVRYYRIKKNRLFLSGKGKRFYVSELPPDHADTDYVKLKLSSCSLWRRFFWKAPAVACLVGITFLGAAGVVYSGIPFHGKLSWFLDEIQNTRWVTLEHDNVMEDGMDGVLSDIRQKVNLPEKLCLVNSFNLHFYPDGRIRTLDTFVNGYDEDGSFVDSYLISFDRRKSDKVRIDLHGGTGGEYEEKKDFGRLVEALRVIPLDVVTVLWEQEEYGILYKGERTWTAWDDNVIYINSQKEIMDAESIVCENQEHTGYSVSVFCPEDESIPPYRYLYVTDEEWAGLEKLADNLRPGSWQGDIRQSDDVQSGNRQNNDVQSGIRQSDDPQSGAQQEAGAIQATGSAYFTSPFKIEDYGTVKREVKEWKNAEGEAVFSSSLERFYVDKKYDYAEKVNAVLDDFYEEKEQEAAENERRHNIDNYSIEEWRMPILPSHEVSCQALSCVDETYFSIIFLDKLYTGGAYSFVTQIGITIDLESGKKLDVLEASGMTREELEAAITEEFQAVQGREGFQGFIGYDGIEVSYRTAGEEWYRVYEEGSSGEGFYLTQDKLCVYFGSEQIAARPMGFPEVAIGR